MFEVKLLNLSTVVSSNNVDILKLVTYPEI